MSIFQLLLTFLGALFKSQRQLALENLGPRQQAAMFRQSVKRPRAKLADKLFWIFFSRHVDGWRTLLHGLHPDTVVRWHRQGFRLYWHWKGRGQKPGRPVLDAALRKLIREMQTSKGGWGAPRIHGELLKLGIEEVITAPRSPWQNPCCEHVIGSIRQDCLDRVIVLNERHLRRILGEYFSYYHNCRTHLSLKKDPPESRTAEPLEMGNVFALPQVGGLHHRYARIAA